MFTISVNDPEYYRDNSHLYKVIGQLEIKPGLYNKKIEDPVILRHMTGYHNNTLIEDEKLGYNIGNLAGYIAGYKILNRPNTYIYKKPNPSLVSINGVSNGEQLLLENKVNSMLPVTNNKGQLLLEYKTMNTLPVAYSAGNTSLVLYDKSKFLPVPVTNNGTLVTQPLTTSRTLATVPLLIGDRAVSQVLSKLPYKQVLKLPVKYPNLTDSENKFLNDYMGKEIPEKIVSKYNDVNKYEYNATTNPGPLAIGEDNAPIKNFYGGMYNDASNESGIFVRMGDKINPYGSWYTKVPKNSEVEARIDFAIKKWWVKPNGEIKIRGLEADKSILDTMYYIEFPERIPKYKGPVGYQGGSFLGGLDQEQYFIPNSWKYGEIIETYPVK